MSLLILVVEDDPVLQMVTRLIVGRLGYDCDVVGSGEQAVDRARDDIALIFMDVGLPGITGINATQLIRENELTEGRKRIPIVALTGHAAEEQCLKAGMDDFLQKPALMDDIRRMIQKWCVDCKTTGGSLP